MHPGAQINLLEAAETSLLGMNSGENGFLIERSWQKKIMHELPQLRNHVYAVLPSFDALHKVIGIFRILQFIGPSLFVGNMRNGDDWNSPAYSNGIVSVLSILWTLLTQMQSLMVVG